ncbi:DNA-binding response regulator [Enterococcus villorum]|uniref:DNA-binding response regulator n=2 Tax=Enterococcus villorum TaxID=112904 RepID=A0A1V8YVP3_9ENTE|nr:LytTR family DNA-binding domain-containing protein [Enterococcus villorum]EOH90778.1 hypothetical protein UAO_00957 [Enterococcus villorum ATCC 700913]EOW77945.1 hypothetical protein I591_00800 [Enterococcus villorum ATCC 700913]OQO71496.1 DNA-binding response regulator [Enterococcus villorum]OQO76671.1 DNA-binding response regulator [Enterococcus villorum]GEL90665.1 DNA-binding response regulator [Enterococcus villorum]
MLKIFVCDDEFVYRNRITNMVKNYLLMKDYDIRFQLATDDPLAILSYISENKTEGIYFLDIDLNSSLNGIELGEKIREYDPAAKIIFVTSYTDLAYLTFIYKVEALDYIVKDNVETLQKKVTECIDIALKRYLNTAQEVRPQILVKSGPINIKLYVDEILYFESSPTPHKLIIHLDNRMIEFLGKIKEVEAINDHFCRCHQSFVVNLLNIKEINKKERIITMKNGSKCFISTRHLKKVVKHFEEMGK